MPGRLRLLTGAATLAGAATFGAGRNAPPPAHSWLQFGGNARHSGANLAERTLSVGNVGRLHLRFEVRLPGTADGAPLYAAGVTTSTGTRNLLYLATREAHIVSLDAATGVLVWSHQNPPGNCVINNASPTCYTTSSPAIFPGLDAVFSYGLDGKVHQYALGTGAEILTGGWPELATLKPYDEKGSAALAAITSTNGSRYLWVASGGYPSDRGDYQGHVTVINLANGNQHVFNTLCSDQSVHFVETPNSPDCPTVQSAVWARAGADYQARLNRVFIATGNGQFAPIQHNWGDSVLALNPDGTGTGTGPLDSYTPASFQQLQNSDADLGSSAPAILPYLRASSVHYLAVQAGKDGRLRLLNLRNLSGHHGPGYTGGEIGAPIAVPQGGAVLTQPAVWADYDSTVWVFVANSNGISGLQITLSRTGTPGLRVRWIRTAGGTSPLVANGVLYYAGGNSIRALDAVTGRQLWHDSSLGGIHWESPIVANGVLYISYEGARLRAYGL